MRAVLDTNVVMSGVFFGGTPARILESLKSGGFELIASSGIIREYRLTATTMRQRYGDAEADIALDQILRGATLVTVPAMNLAVCRDPKDEMFLECAVVATDESGPPVIVTGDRDLLVLNG